MHLNLGKRSGKLRIADTGLGWKATEGGGEPFTLAASELRSANWFKASRGYELKLTQKNGTIIRIDNLGEEDFDRVASALEDKYKLELSQVDHALKGWNWGETDFHGSELAFKVNGKNAFDLPLQYITNTNLTGKQEVSVEFELPGEEDGDDRDAKKAARHVDQMVEIRFYVPGVLDKDEDAEEDEEEMSAAQGFYETLKDKADVGEVAGSAIAAFSDVVLLTPRFVTMIVDASTCTNAVLGDDMMSICMRLHSAYVERRTTTKCNFRALSTCFYYLVRMSRM